MSENPYTSLKREVRKGEHCIRVTIAGGGSVVVRYDELVDALDQMSNFHRCEEILVREVGV